jgi:hypothetical protein
MFVLVLLVFVFFPVFRSDGMEEPAGYSFSEGKAATTIKFTFFRNLIVIPVKLNDTLKLNLILDTGTRSMILFGRKIKKLRNINVHRKIEVNGRGIYKSSKASFSFPNRIDIGDVVGNGVGAVVISEGDLMDALPGIDGVIGYELFVRFCIQVDYANRLITLYNNIPVNAHDSFHSFAIDVKDQRPEIVSSIQTSKGNNLSVRTLIDTGSSLGLLVFSSKAEKFNTIGEEREIGIGLAGSVVGFSLPIFSYQLANVEFFLTDCQLVPTRIESGKDFEVSASLGGNFLKDYVIMFSYATAQFFIKVRKAGCISKLQESL